MEAFAVDSTTMQLAWGGLPKGTSSVGVTAPEVAVRVEGEGPGTALITGLTSATTYDLRIDGRVVGSARTLDELPGQELFRFATVNDCHLGELGFGVLFRQKDRRPGEPYPLRCLRAALRSALDWGAQAMVIKGDLVQRGGAGEFATARDLLAAVIGERDVPVFATPGNHESKLVGPKAPPTSGIAFDLDVVSRSFPGLTLVTANSSVPNHHHGHAAWADEAVAAVAAAPGAVVLAMHHQVQKRLSYWPPGILGDAGDDLTRRLGEANPNVWVVSGHTHRNRTYERNGVLLTEVGSTKDYPGSWAGYVVTDKAIRQTVWKVTGDGADDWLWRTRRGAGGLWGRWSPGTLDDRCVTRVLAPAEQRTGPRRESAAAASGRPA